MKNEEINIINISDLKISKKRKNGFSNDSYSFMIPDNFEIKYDVDDRDFIAYSNDSDEWESALVVIYSGEVTPFKDIENNIRTINTLLLIQDYGYWNTTYDEFKMLFGGSEYYNVELENTLGRVICVNNEYFTSFYFVTCINEGYKQIHIEFNNVTGSFDKLLESAIQIMNGFKIENNNLVINDIDDIRYLTGEFSINDWINNLDKIGKELQFNLGFKAKVELTKKTKLLTDEKRYPDNFSSVIKKLSDNYVKSFDKTLKNIETYLDKLKEKKTNNKNIDTIHKEVINFCEKYKKYSLETDDGLIISESNYVNDFYKKTGLNNTDKKDALDDISNWKKEVEEIENIINKRLDELTNKFNENLNKELTNLEKKKNSQLEELEQKEENLKINIEKNNKEIESLSFINFMKKKELKSINEKMLKDIDEIANKKNKINKDYQKQKNEINSNRDEELEKILNEEKEIYLIPENPTTIMKKHEKDKNNIDEEYYEKLKAQKIILSCLNSSFNPVSIIKMKEMNDNLSEYSSLFMFSVLDELVRINKVSQTIVSGTAYFSISDKSKYDILKKIILKDKNINTKFAKDRTLILTQIKSLVDSELKVSFDTLSENICSKDISMIRLLQVLKSLVDEKILFKKTIDNTITYYIDCKNIIKGVQKCN